MGPSPEHQPPVPVPAMLPGRRLPLLCGLHLCCRLAAGEPRVLCPCYCHSGAYT